MVTSRKWDPVRDLLTLQERMNRLFEESLARGKGLDAPFVSGSWCPLADVYETVDAFVITVELPGLAEDDIDVQAEADQLTLRGERRMAGQARPESFHRMERSYGFFSRTFTFDEEVDPSRLRAQFRDGLLQIEVPKARPRGPWRARAEGGQ